MSTGARVENLDAIRTFKVHLLKFAEKAQAAMEDAESDMQRTLNWLETEQPAYWANQLRKRQQLLSSAQESLRMKKLFKDSTGRTPSAVDEERAVAAAKRRLEQAEQKGMATKQWARRIQKEIMLYKGHAMRLVTACSTDIPAAAAQLNNILLKLEEYMAVGPVEAASAAAGGAGAGAMARAADAAAAAGEPSPYAELRGRTPSAMIRDAAEIAHPDEVQWRSGTILAHDLSALAAASLPQQETEPGERIICAAEVWNSPAIYFERTVRLPDGSSWYVGPADDANPVTTCVSVRADELLHRRPDLRDILDLPQGSLVVIAGGKGIGAVLDAQNQDVLRRPVAPTSESDATSGEPEHIKS